MKEYTRLPEIYNMQYMYTSASSKTGLEFIDKDEYFGNLDEYR